MTVEEKQIVYTNQAVMTKEEIYSKIKSTHDSGVSWCTEQKIPESHIYNLKKDTYTVKWDDLCRYYWVVGIEDEF
ncbi:hypothetical protein KLEP7_gp144 [Pseudaeromonas phage vB_PpeM_ KLEP7]|nr:hypothetical protein KLEP7_gp144 [Pseudaeromonas phage vB_PpeM_ KLEP7]